MTRARVLSAVVLAALAPAIGPDTGEAQQPAGARLYERDCAWCHGADGGGSSNGPSLAGVGAASAHFYLSTGRMPIDEPKPARRGKPAYSPAEIAALVDVVAGFGRGPAVPEVDVATGDLSRGGRLYRVSCAPCHGFSGFGGGLAFSRNAPDVWQATPTQVVEAMLIGLPGMPTFGPGALSDEEREAIAAYVTRVLQQPREPGGHGLARTGPVSEGIVAWLVGFAALFLVAFLLGERRPTGDGEVR